MNRLKRRKIMTRVARFLLLPLLPLMLLMSMSAYAFNLLFLKDAPVAEFDSIDTGLMMESFYHAMDNNDNGVGAEWENQDTGHHGIVTPLDRTRLDNITCRNVEVENNATINSGRSQFKFCREDGGKWLISE
jgi:surface antigen